MESLAYRWRDIWSVVVLVGIRGRLRLASHVHDGMGEWHKKTRGSRRRGGEASKTVNVAHGTVEVR